MHTFDFSSDGFLSIFSSLIAEASMTLPPLTNEGDTDFLQAMQMLAMKTFWNEYCEGLPPEANAEREDAVIRQDADAFIQWFADYADFEHNAECRGLASALLEEMRTELPSIMKERYADFRTALVA